LNEFIVREIDDRSRAEQSLKFILFIQVRRETGRVHSKREPARPGGVDVPVQANHSDGGQDRRAERAVESVERDRRGHLRGHDLRGDCAASSGRVCAARPGQVPLQVPERRVLPGPGGPSRARHHGAREARVRAGGVSPGRDAMHSGLLSEQDRRRAALPESALAYGDQALAARLRMSTRGDHN
jgi:hypothetical protein